MPYAGVIITQLGVDLAPLSRGFQQAVSMGQSYERTMNRATESTSSGFAQHTRSILAAGAGIGGWIYAIKGAGEAAVGLGKALLGPNASMEQTQVAFVGLTGSVGAAQKEMKALQAFADTTPFEFPELAEDAMLLQGVGLAANKVIPTMDAIGSAGSRMGIGAEGVNRVTIAITQMIAKGTIAGDEMEQLTEARIPAWVILSKQMGIPVDQLRKMGAEGKLGKDAIDKLIVGMKQFGGSAMQDQNKTMIGLISTLKDKVGEAMRAFTGPLFESAKGGIAKLLEILQSPGFAAFEKTVSQGIAVAFQKIGQAIGPVVSSIGQFISSLTAGGQAGAGGQFLSTVQQIADIFGGGLMDEFQQVSGFVTGSLIPAIQGLMPTFQRIGDLVMTTIVPAFLQIWPIVNQVASVIRQVFLAAISALLPVIVNLANFLSSIIVPAFKFLAPYIVMAAKEVGKFATEIGTLVIPIIQNFARGLMVIIDWLKTTWNTYWPTMAPIVEGVFTIIKGIIQQAWAIISGIIKIALNLLQGNWSGAWNACKDMLNGVWEGIKNIIAGAIQAVLGMISGILGGIRDSLPAPFRAAWDKIFGIHEDAKTKTAIQMDQMKVQQIDAALKTAEGTIARFDMQRQGIIKQIADTKDPARKHALEMQLQQITIAEENAKSVIAQEKKKKDEILRHQAELKKQAEENSKNIFQKAVEWAGRTKDEVVHQWNILKDNIGSVLKGFVNNVINWLNTGIFKFQDFLNFMVEGINKVADFFHIGHLDNVIIGPITPLARGTDEFAGGLAMVGERGRELVVLPTGTKVYTNKETEQMVRGGSPVPVPHLAAGTGAGGDIFSTVLAIINGGVDTVLSSLFSGAPGLFGFASNWGGKILEKVGGWFADWIKANIGSLFSSGVHVGTLPMLQQGQFIVPPWLTYPGHHGVDFQFGQNTPIPEVIGGIVSPHTGWYGWGGEVDILIDRIAGMWERYMHMEQIFVRAGQRVNRGQLVGLSGGGTPESGYPAWSNGPHLHYQTDWGDYGAWVWPFDVWASLGIFKPWGKGGIINEKIRGIGTRTGQPYLLGEGGSETITPAYQQSRMIELLERIERVLTGNGPISEWTVQQALGKLLANGVRI